MESTSDIYLDMFKKYDKNGNATIDRSDVVEMLREIKGHPPTQKQVDTLLERVDLNHDGTITYTEFKKVMIGMAEAKQKEIEECFRAFDKDNSGYIDLDELRDVLSVSNEEVDDSHVACIMETYDLNKDGKISLSEFVNICKDLKI